MEDIMGKSLVPRVRFGPATVYVVLLSGGLLVIALVLSSVIGNAPIIWSMEDSYLYHTFGRHLAQGRFLTYSISEPHANGNTSFLYYLVVGGIHTVAKALVSDSALSAITLALWITFGVHAALYEICIALFTRLLLRHSINPLLVLLVCGATFFNGPMIYGFFCGLEPPLTVLLIVMLLAGIINSDGVEFSALALMTLHRPESMLVAVVYAVLRYGWVAASNRKLVHLVPAILLMLSCSLVPVLNFVFIGQFTTLSSARIGLHALQGDVSLLRALLGRFTHFSYWLESARVVVSAIVPWAFSTERSILGFTSMQRLLLSSIWPIGMVVFSIGLIRRKSVGRCSIAAFIVLSCWVATVAILGGGTGEFARYVVVVFPLVAFLVASTLDHLSRSRILVLFLAILSLIPCLTSSLDVVDHFRRGTTFLHELHFQAALTIRDNPDMKSVAFWETGILSLYLSDKKRVIDLYGLGTTRYANLPHGGGESKVLQLIQDKPDTLVQWGPWGNGNAPEQQFLKLLRQHSVTVQTIRTFSVDASLYLWQDPYPHQMTIYALSYR